MTGDDVSAGADDRVMSVGPDNGVIVVGSLVGEVNTDVSRVTSVSSSKGGEAGEYLSGAGVASSMMGTLATELVL